MEQWDLAKILRYGLLAYGVYRTLGPKFLLGLGIGYFVGKKAIPLMKEEKPTAGYVRTIDLKALPPAR